MRRSGDPADSPAGLPDPEAARDLDGVAERLRALKAWAGEPSFEAIKDRVNAALAVAGHPAGDAVGRTTVVDCFRPGRRRLNSELVVAVVAALHPDRGYAARWRHALRVVGGEVRAAAQVRVRGELPRELAAFTGRSTELARLRRAFAGAREAGGAVAISAIEGMAGVGKTQLALRAGRLLAGRTAFDHVLFVNLRGFHADPAQPPADPAAVLDGFLRLLGVPGQQIPHDLDGRNAAYRARLAGRRALVVLDNAASEEQVRPLLPRTPGCLTLVTSRRRLAGLENATHVTVDAFSPDEAVRFLTRSVPDVPVGTDPAAAERIARRCGCLPLALGLLARQLRARAGWSLTDHADRLDERHGYGRLEDGVELAFDVSYRNLPAEPQRLLRLLSLHPGQDFDAYAAAALSDTDTATARARLRDLCDDHLVQRVGADRYAFHDLVRAYAAGRSEDEDRPLERRGALTRLLDHYLGTAAAAMDAVHPAEARYRPRVEPPGTPVPRVADPDAALAWLDNERATLAAATAHAATNGWPAHASRLSSTLYRYLSGGYPTDAATIHGHALEAARADGDPAGQATALLGLADADLQSGRHQAAGDRFRRATRLFRRAGDPVGEARAQTGFGIACSRAGRYESAADHHARAAALFRRSADPVGEARASTSLALVQTYLGRYGSAVGHLRHALALARRSGNLTGEAAALTSLGAVEERLGEYERAADHQLQALTLFGRAGNRSAEAHVHESLAIAYLRLGKLDLATDHHGLALARFREIGESHGEASALNGLGEAAHAAGQHAEAVEHHRAALTTATRIDSRAEQARAHSGLGHAHAALSDPDSAHPHYRQALALYEALHLPDADDIRPLLDHRGATG